MFYSGSFQLLFSSDKDPEKYKHFFEEKKRVLNGMSIFFPFNKIKCM